MKDIPVQIQPERRAHVQQHRPDRTATIIVHTKNDQQRAWNSLNNSLRQITDHKDSYIKSKVKRIKLIEKNSTPMDIFCL